MSNKKQRAAEAQFSAPPAIEQLEQLAESHAAPEDDLSAFSEMENSQLVEQTAGYKNFSVPGESINVTFLGIENRSLDKEHPDKVSECVIGRDLNGLNHLFAQTIIVNEVKKIWDKKGRTGFPLRFIYEGEQGTGASKYQKFRVITN